MSKSKVITTINHKTETMEVMPNLRRKPQSTKGTDHYIMVITTVSSCACTFLNQIINMGLNLICDLLKLV